jgi:Fe-S cluster biogenesis protein NfuA
MSEQTLDMQIEEVINNQIRPYIEADGGTIDFIEMRENIVYVELAGACGTCPSARMTLKGGVEAILKRRFPQIQAVEMARAQDPYSF